MGRRLLILGPPGAGKGTQAAVLCQAVGIPHISTGEMLRDHVARDTPLGRRAREIMEGGDLVPDEIVIGMVDDRISQPDAACGFLLDGFPRTRTQAEALDEVLDGEGLDAVIVVEVPEDELVERILRRGRSDDTADTVRNRLAVYHGQTAPLIEFYLERGLVRTVNGVGTIEEVLARIVGVLAE